MNLLRSEGGSNVLILLILPAIVSLIVTLGILRIWEGRQANDVVILPTDSPTSQAVAASNDDQPDADATAEPAGEPCDNPIHTVAAGETLGTIAEQYEVILGELIEANQVVNADFNPDFISIQQEIIIPLCGVPTPVPAAVPTNTPRPTSAAPIATNTNLPAGTVAISIANVISPGDITSEGVEIINEGTPINLSGWVLTDGDEEYEFPGFSIFTGGSVTVYTGAGEDDVRSLYWGLDTALWTPGTTVELYNATGDLIASLTVEG